MVIWFRNEEGYNAAIVLLTFNAERYKILL
jgi:hypothetical protein